MFGYMNCNFDIAFLSSISSDSPWAFRYSTAVDAPTRVLLLYTKRELLAYRPIHQDLF